MQTALPVSLSAQLAMEKRLETIAHNLANARTAGFRSEEVKFEQLISSAAQKPVAFVSEGETYLSRASGELTRTDNTLDMAIGGDAWFGIQTPQGRVYTRDGRMRIDAEGNLQTLNGYGILDAGGSPISVNPNGGPLTIARDGMIQQAGQQVGAVGLFAIPQTANLTRFDNSGVLSDQPVQPVIDFNGLAVEQGFVEGSNVNPILAITRLIEVQRAFESASNLIQSSEKTLDGAVRDLGTVS
jgi:flagellar basal-body rod protein FlgF